MLSDRIRAGLDELRAQELLRSPRVVDRFRGPFAIVEGREVLNFASNDYLGLAQDPRIAEAAARAGWGSTGSRLLCGTTRLHVALEEAIADFLGAEAALFFPSGYMANLGMVAAVAGPETTILSDEWNHASLIDACRLGRARVVRVPHADLDAYDSALRGPGGKIVLTDTVFSMDGDVAPLRALSDLADRRGADLVVDDAHGFGIFGEGRGVVAESGARVALRTVTLSKAAGCAGGAVVGDREAIEFLRTRARTFMFTTAPPPALCAAAIEALRLMRDGSLRTKLWSNARRLDPRAASPIVPVILGDNARAVGESRRLWDRGLWVPAVRPPAVPPGTARLRISLSAAHEPAHVDALRCALSESS
ncbi:MAG: 8-amino-7-oxononanoate synthase [Planctomycetes bacterium]|nr:8-amino-7-oxononanoate synthase [Planctomycetota bacterium]